LKNLQALGLPPALFSRQLAYNTFPPDTLASGGWVLCLQTPSSKLLGFTPKKSHSKNFCFFGKSAVQNGYTTLWCDYFGAARFVVTLFCIAHFVAGPLWSRPFRHEFHKKIFFLLFSFFNFSIFLIYKNYFFPVFFSKSVEHFSFIFNKFLCTLHNFFIRLFQ